MNCITQRPVNPVTIKKAPLQALEIIDILSHFYQLLNASAPATISLSSVVIAACLARL